MALLWKKPAEFEARRQLNARGGFRAIECRDAQWICMGADSNTRTSEAPHTRAGITSDLRRLGVSTGQVLMVHSSLSAIGHVLGRRSRVYTNSVPNCCCSGWASIGPHCFTLPNPAYRTGGGRCGRFRWMPAASGYGSPHRMWVMI